MKYKRITCPCRNAGFDFLTAPCCLFLFSSLLPALALAKVRRAALKHLELVLRRDKQRLAELVLEGREVDPVVSRLLTGLLELSTGKLVVA